MIVHRNTEPTPPARVVLLGARGFIGAALERRLRADRVNVLPLASRDIDLSGDSAADELARRLKPDDSVVMLAALTPDKGRDIAATMKNLAMMQQLCRALERTVCAHLVYFSSDAVYGLAASRVTEETPTSAQDLYGAMHLTREMMARTLVKAPLLILRPTLVYGAGDTHNAYGPNRFLGSAQKDGKIQLFGGGEETRDHIHVDDVAAITVRCLVRGSTGTLNLATGVSTSFRDVAALVARRAGQRVRIVESGRANPITHRHYDVTLLIKAFPGHRFIPLEQGIAAQA